MQVTEGRMFNQWKDEIYARHRERCAGKYPIGECWPPGPAGLLRRIQESMNKDQVRMLEMRIDIQPMQPWRFITKDKF